MKEDIDPDSRKLIDEYLLKRRKLIKAEYKSIKEDPVPRQQNETIGEHLHDLKNVYRRLNALIAATETIHNISERKLLSLIHI